jgi:hypothetical protein
VILVAHASFERADVARRAVPVAAPILLGGRAAAKSRGFMILGTLFLLPLMVMYAGWPYWMFRSKVKPGTGYH